MSGNGSGTRKVALITGASAGLGAAIARRAAARGFDLAITARRLDRLERLGHEIHEANPGVTVHPIAEALDDPGAAERIVARALDRFGRLDVLVNNAGFGLPTLFADGDPIELRRQLEVNLVAPLMLARHAIPALRETRGVIVNIGSAITCVPNPALGAYGATKAGLAYWNDALRRELRSSGVRVCLVEPGPVKTEFFDAILGRVDREGGYHPMLDSPAPWMSARVDDVAARIVGLLERPRRRLSVLKRVVWPFRLVGACFRLWPALGDTTLVAMLDYHGRRVPRRAPSGNLTHARSTE